MTPGGLVGVRNVSDADLIELLPWVRRVAHGMMRTLPPHVLVGDYVAAGYEGLILAAGRYNPNLGVPFPAYAHARVKGAMLDWSRETDWLTRREREDNRTLPPPMSMQQAFVNHSGRNPNGRDLEVGETLVDPDDFTAAAEARIIIGNVLPRLTARYQWVIVSRYWSDTPLKVIGADLGVSESRASQMETWALKAMRVWIEETSPPELITPRSGLFRVPRLSRFEVGERRDNVAVMFLAGDNQATIRVALGLTAAVTKQDVAWLRACHRIPAADKR